MTVGALAPMVYLAGPYSSPDPISNTNIAIAAASQILRDGLVVPFVPHLSLFWHLVSPQPYETWLEYDFDVIRHCQAMLRLHGESAGADREVAFAQELGLPVFETLSDLSAWALAQ